jgi:hypothetical protein
LETRTHDKPGVLGVVRVHVHHYDFPVPVALALFICLMEWIAIRSKTYIGPQNKKKQIGQGLDRDNGTGLDQLEKE